METQQITLERDAARALWRKYREHQHYAKPIDWEIQRTYQLIAQGRLVIKALESIRTAGVGEDGLPQAGDLPRRRPELFLRVAVGRRHSHGEPGLDSEQEPAPTYRFPC